MRRAQRLIALLALLQARRTATADALATEFGVSTRTILRDVRALVDAEVPIVAERGRYGGLTLLPGAQVDLSRLTETEADVFRAVGVDLARARQLGAEGTARTVLAKLDGRRPPSASRAPAPLLPLSEVVTIDNRPWFAGEPETDVASLAQELRRARRLHIRYRRSGQNAAREIEVDPHGLLLRADRWYLIAESGGGPSMFALARLESWRASDAPRKLPPGASLPEIARRLGERLESRQQVVVHASLRADRLDLARRILGSRLRSAGEPDRHGRTPVAVAYDQLDGVRQLLQFGDHIEVTAPAEARALVHRLGRELAAAHRP